MNNNTDPLKKLWQRIQAQRMTVVLVVLLVTLFVALAGYPWVWLIGGAIVLAVLLPSLLQMGAGSTNTQASPNSTLMPARNIDLSRLQGTYHELMQHALNTRRGIEDAVNQTQDPGQRRVLADSVRDLPELTNNIYNLALKAQSVQDGLGGANPIDRLTGDIERLDATIKGTTDEFQKSQYYASMDGKLQQMQNITDTTVALRRWEAQIENAVSTLDTLLSQVLRIKSSEVLSYSGATDQLSDDLKREVDSLKAAAEAMDNVYGWQKT